MVGSQSLLDTYKLTGLENRPYDNSFVLFHGRQRISSLHIDFVHLLLLPIGLDLGMHEKGICFLEASQHIS